MNRSRSSWLCMFVFAIAFAATFGVARAEDAANDDAPRIADFAFMAGCWIAEKDGDKMQECWTAPEGNCLIGGFRWLKDGKLWMSEHITIIDEGDAIMFRLRHFSDKSAAWEEKDQPIAGKLVSLEGKKATFADVNVEGRQFIFDGSADDVYSVTLIGKDKDGARTERTFTFQRMEM